MNAVAEAVHSTDDKLAIRYIVNPHLRIVHTSDDEILVKHSARSPFSRVIRDDGRTKLIGRLLRSLRQAASIDDLLAKGVVIEKEAEVVLELLDYLVQEQVIVAQGRDAVEVYLRSILGAGTPLETATVGMVGAGYLGSRIAEELGRLSVGRLVVQDDRRIEDEAVDRRYFRLPADCIKPGRGYVESLARHFKALNYGKFEGIRAAVDDQHALKRLFAETDFVVCALEALSSHTLHVVNEVALEAAKPWLCVHTDGSEAFIGPIFVPGESACYNEFEVQYEAACLGVKDEYLTYKEALDKAGMQATHLVLPPYLETTAGMAAVGVLHFLTSGQSFLTGRCVRMDFERLSVDYEEVLRLPRCPACAPYRPYRHTYL